MATNGTIVVDGNININGERKEGVEEEMILIPQKLTSFYFPDSTTETYTTESISDDINIHINRPMAAEGNLELTGNINLGDKAI